MSLLIKLRAHYQESESSKGSFYDNKIYENKINGLNINNNELYYKNKIYTRI